MDTFQWLKKLIGFNTISSDSNMQMIEAIDAWFKLHDIDSQILLGHETGKANLFATIPAQNGQTQGGIILSGHTDVVPTVGQLWDTDPFVAVEKDSRIYGRGACDMKGFIAVLLALVPEFKKLKLTKPIHYSFSYDEEIGCIGVEFLLEHLEKIGIKPEGCIVGEPSSMKPIIGEKSRQVYHCQVQGLAAHSSLVNRGCNAIEYASNLICYIKKLADELKGNGPFDHDFDLPFTTITTTVVSGGIASNVIPGTCEFIFDIRYLPEFPVKAFCSQIENYIHNELEPEMKKIYPLAAIHLTQTSDAAGFSADDKAAITRAVYKETGVTERLKVSYTTEAGIFEEAGIPTIVCGPGDIDQAHRANEFVSFEQLKRCEEVFRNIIHSFCVDPEAIEF
jgi:acetylornithine deacetylase